MLDKQVLETRGIQNAASRFYVSDTTEEWMHFQSSSNFKKITAFTIREKRTRTNELIYVRTVGRSPFD